MTTPDPAAIAKGLTEEEKTCVLDPDAELCGGCCSASLLDKKLVRHVWQNIGSHPICIGYRLTPLGVAVRDELKGGNYANET